MRCVIRKSGDIAVESSWALAPQDGFCVFSVKAAGICGSDLPRAFDGGAYHYPIVVGHEFAGVVKESTNQALVGKRACVFPILPCGKCSFCKKQLFANCENYDYYGSRRDGGMQSALVVRETNLIFLPDHVSYEAAAMIEPTAVCLHAIKKANIDENATVLVYGAGTIGLLSAMWARAYGAKTVFVQDIDERRLAMARSLGFATYADEPVNTIIEASGAPAALNDAISRCEAFGKLLLVGHGKKDVTIAHTAFVQILRKQLTLFGCWNSDHSDTSDDWRDAISAIADGKIDPTVLITHRIPLARAPEAFRIAIDREELSNKVMVVMEDEE